MRMKTILRFGTLLAGIVLIFAPFFVCGPSDQAERQQVTTVLDVVVSQEAYEWMRDAEQEFERTRPDVHVRLTALGTREATDGIFERKITPLVWSPTSTFVLELVNEDYAKRYERPLFASHGEDSPQSLFTTPLVWLGREERIAPLLASQIAEGKAAGLYWSTLRTAALQHKGKAPLRLLHTDPAWSYSGLSALNLMTLEFFGSPPRLSTEDLENAELLAWLTDIERSVVERPSSNEKLKNEILRFGAAGYDLALVYEKIAIEILENATTPSDLRIAYPALTMWADHPIVILDPVEATPVQRESARRWVRFLMGSWAQERALARGFRPADGRVIQNSAKNPFVSLRGKGLLLEPPNTAAPLTPEVARKFYPVSSKLRAAFPAVRDPAPGAAASVVE